MENLEKPKFLYHGSARGDIEEFEPLVSLGSGEKYGALVYATPDLATAIIFTVHTQGAGGFKYKGERVAYVLITEPREKFIAEDKGGYVYVLPSDNFSSEEGRGFGDLEWASSVAVKPIEKIFFPSSLNAMIEHGIQVYFISNSVREETRISEDHGYSILKSMQSENQLRGQNVKEF